MYCVRTSTLIGSIWNAVDARRDATNVGDASGVRAGRAAPKPCAASASRRASPDDSCAGVAAYARNVARP